MRLRALSISAALILILFTAWPCLGEEEACPTSNEAALLALINQARQAPLDAAAALGLDPDKVLRDLPDLAGVLTNGMQPLVLDERLCLAAQAHTQEMLEYEYHSHESLDGRTYDDRIAEAGYAAVVTGESLGMLGFASFIPPAEAVRYIFEDMLRNELDPLGTGQRKLLNPAFQDAGIALGTGTLTAGQWTYNVYRATCDFAAGASQLERELFHLLNQARQNPLAMAEWCGLDPDQVVEDLPELNQVLLEGLPPVILDPFLLRTARAHSGDMLLNGLFSSVSGDGRTPEERIVESGYDPSPLVVGEAVGKRCMSEDTPEEIIAGRIFRALFRRELKSSFSGEKTILGAEFTEVGIGFVTGVSEALAGICGDNVGLLTMDFGARAEQSGPCVMGAVYVDSNNDGLCGFGEGLGGVRVEIAAVGAHEEAGEEEAAVTTDEAGGFVVFCEPGEYKLRVVLEEARMLKDETYEVAVVLGLDSAALYVRAGEPLEDEVVEEVK